MKRPVRAGELLRPALVIAAFLGLSAPAMAQTILLVIQESAAGQPLAAPLPLGEGLDASFFDAGIIVFDMPGVTPATTAAEISRVAQGAGADAILEVQADYAQTPSGGEASVSVHVTWSLLVSASGAVIAKGTRDASNSGREHDGRSPRRRA